MNISFVLHKLNKLKLSEPISVRHEETILIHKCTQEQSVNKFVLLLRFSILVTYRCIKSVLCLTNSLICSSTRDYPSFTCGRWTRTRLHLMTDSVIFIGKCVSYILTEKPLEVFLNGNSPKFNEFSEFMESDQCRLNWGQYKDPVSYLCFAGWVVVLLQKKMLLNSLNSVNKFKQNVRTTFQRLSNSSIMFISCSCSNSSAFYRSI